MNSDSQDSPTSPFGIPGAGNLQSIMESMQKAWGFAAAQPVAPTLDIDEIDRRLADLNTVSQWLALNQKLLQSTIQALQVQRATLAAIQSFGMLPQTESATEPGNSAMDLMQSFAQSFASAPRAAAPDAARTLIALLTAPAADAPPQPEPAASATNPASPGFDPQQWWDMLQDQFARVASSALETPAPAATAKRAAASPRKKPAAKKPAAKKRASAAKSTKSTRER